MYADQPQGGSISLSLDSGNYECLGQVQEYKTPERFDVYKKCYHFSIGVDEVSKRNFKIKGVNIHYEPQSEIL